MAHASCQHLRIKEMQYLTSTVLAYFPLNTRKECRPVNGVPCGSRVDPGQCDGVGDMDGAPELSAGLPAPPHTLTLGWSPARPGCLPGLCPPQPTPPSVPELQFSLAAAPRRDMLALWPMVLPLVLCCFWLRVTWLSAFRTGALGHDLQPRIWGPRPLCPWPPWPSSETRPNSVKAYFGIGGCVLSGTGTSRSSQAPWEAEGVPDAPLCQHWVRRNLRCSGWTPEPDFRGSLHPRV